MKPTLTVSMLVLSLLVVSNIPGGMASRSGVTEIVVISAPTKASPGQKLTFTWEVSGIGKITHTAVHWDTKPGNPADFKSYAKATPEFASLNPPDFAPKGYTVSFNAPDSGAIFWIIHAIVEASQIYMTDGEKILQIGAPQNAVIEVKSVPATAATGGKLTFAWEIKGSGKVSHTAVHWDTKPGNPADFKSYPKATPEYAAITPPQDAPKGYSVSFQAPQAGRVYYVIHAIVDGQNLYAAGGERVVPIAPVAGDPAPKGDAPKEDAMKKGDSPKETAAYAGIDNTTLMVGAGAAIVIVAVAAFAFTRRRPKS